MRCADDALLLVGHGSARYPEAGRALHAHAATLLAAGAVAEAAVGLLAGTPSVATALASLTAPRVRLVPFFMEDGWFTRSAIPAALDLGGDPTAGGRLCRCPPVGLHPGVAALIEARALSACGGAAAWALVLVGHGSRRRPGRRLALHAHRDRLAATGRFGRVAAACLEEPPFLPAVLAGCAAMPVAVIGVFAGEGGHVKDDLPALLRAEAERRAGGPALCDLGSIGDDPGFGQIILDQMAESGWPPEVSG